MLDLSRIALASVAARSAIAPGLAFCVGVGTSVGPCVAPRLLAVAALASAARSRTERWCALAALAFGLCSMYVVLGIAVAVLRRLTSDSTWVYAICAVLFVIAGIRTLVNAQVSHKHAGFQENADFQVTKVRTSVGASFLLGCSFGLIVSPCCTPFVAALAAYTAGSASPWFAAMTLFAFGLGHVLPLVFAGLGLGRLRHALAHFEGAIATVGGALLIALGGYYAVLA